MISRIKTGFTLPTVVVVSMMMMALIGVALQISVVASNALRDTYYQQLAAEAAEAGGKMAEECLRGGTDWTQPLRPGSSCSGSATQCTSADCYVVDTGRVRSVFSVNPAAVDGDYVHVVLEGSAQLYSGATVGRTYSWNYKVQFFRGVSAGGGDGSGYTSGALQSMAMGEDHTCVINVDRDLYCWGDNGDGQLGTGNTNNQATPTPVSKSGVLSGLTILSVSASERHTCVLASDNYAYCWGDNGNGQLGTGNTTNYTSPVAVTRTGALSGLSILQIAAGEQHTCVLASNGVVYCWGEGGDGQLGRGSTSDSLSPVAVQSTGALNGLSITQLSAGARHVCVLASDSNAYCWGRGSDGQIGNGSTSNRSVPTAVSRTGALNGLSLRKVSAGGFNSCAVASNGQAYCWGDNSAGQIGDGTSTMRSSPVAVRVSGVLSGKQITSVNPSAEFGTGGAHACAIDSNYAMYCWGDNDDGQLGDGTKTNRSAPVAVASPLTEQQPVYMVLAESATCVSAIGNVLYCWGDNSDGQLGLPGGSDRTLAELVPGFSPLVEGPPSATADNLSWIYY